MAISYSGEGYKFQPQFANLGALQGLQPLDVTRKAEFQLQPLTYAPIPSSRPELVSEGISKGILAAVGGITEGITAKYSAEQKREEKLAERKHERQLVALKYGLDKTETEEKAKDYIARQKALIDYRNDTAKRLKGSLGENFPIYGGDTTTETEAQPEPVSLEGEQVEDELPADFDTTLNELEGTSLFGQLAPADAMQAQIAEQAKQLQGLSPEYLTAGLEAGVVAPIQPVPQMSLEGFKATAISPEQAAQATEVRKELRQTLAGIKPVKPEVAKSEAQRPGWYPIEKAQEEASRNILGWKPAKIDETNVKNVGGVPYYLVKPREAMTAKEISEAQKATDTGVNFETEKKLRDEYVGQTKDFKTIQSAWRSIKTSGGEPSAAGDMSLIFGYMKLLDPGSTVREGEYANAQNAGGVPDRVVASYNKLINGQILSDAQRKDFLGQAKKQYDSRRGEYGELKKSYTSLAKEYGLEPKRVVVEFDMPEEVTQQQAQQGQKEALAAQLDAMADKQGTPEYKALYSQLKEIVMQEKKGRQTTTQPTQTQQPVSRPVFQPAIPKPATQYGETLESFLGNK